MAYVDQEVSDEGVPMGSVNFGAVQGLPPRQSGVTYVVSILVALASGRDDLVVAAREVRDADGRVIGCQGVAHVEQLALRDQGDR